MAPIILLRRVVILFTLCAFASPCWAHNMMITVNRARGSPNLTYDGRAYMSLIAILTVDGVRVGPDVEVGWNMSPPDGGLLLLLPPTLTTDACGVATATAVATGFKTGLYFVICRWTDPNNPNHFHQGLTPITLTSDACPTRTLTDDDVEMNCVNRVRPVRCNVKVSYLLDENPDPTKRKRRMSTELNTAIGSWNSATHQIKFVRDDFTLFPNVLVRDICREDDPWIAFAECPFVDPNNPSVIARIQLNVHLMAGNCDDHQNGWCHYDWPWDRPANESTIAHELGHVLGIKETVTEKGMLMYHVGDANWFECAINEPTFTEVVKINELYPGNP